MKRNEGSWQQCVARPVPSALGRYKRRPYIHQSSDLSARLILLQSIIYCLPSLPFPFFLHLFPLSVGPRGVVALVDDQVLGPVVVLAGEVALEDGLGAGGVPLLRVDRRARHVRDHGVAAAPRVLGRPERVVPGRRLREPDVAAVAAEVTRLQRLGYVLLDDDGATGRVNQP